MLNQLLLDRQRDIRELIDYLQELKDWANHVAQWRLPRVVEARRRLRVVQGRMDRLFEREVAITEEISQTASTKAEWPESVRRAENDRFQLRKKLSALILRLERADAEFEDWRPVLYELSLFVDSVVQHNELFCGYIVLETPSSEAVPKSRD